MMRIGSICIIGFPFKSPVNKTIGTWVCSNILFTINNKVKYFGILYGELYTICHYCQKGFQYIFGQIHRRTLLEILILILILRFIECFIFFVQYFIVDMGWKMHAGLAAIVTRLCSVLEGFWKARFPGFCCNHGVRQDRLQVVSP